MRSPHLWRGRPSPLRPPRARPASRFSRFLQELRETPRAEGCPRVWIHGEKELEGEARRRSEGIPMNEKTIAELRSIAADLSLPEPFFLK